MDCTSPSTWLPATSAPKGQVIPSMNRSSLCTALTAVQMIINFIHAYIHAYYIVKVDFVYRFKACLCTITGMPAFGDLHVTVICALTGVAAESYVDREFILLLDNRCLSQPCSSMWGVV